MNDMKKLEDFNFDGLSELDLQGLVEESIEDDVRNITESIANDIEKIDLQQLADILEVSSHIITANYAGMLINTFIHPAIGWVTTVQTSGNGALLIKHL